MIHFASTVVLGAKAGLPADPTLSWRCPQTLQTAMSAQSSQKHCPMSQYSVTWHFKLPSQSKVLWGSHHFDLFHWQAFEIEWRKFYLQATSLAHQLGNSAVTNAKSAPTWTERGHSARNRLARTALRVEDGVHETEKPSQIGSVLSGEITRSLACAGKARTEP